MTLETLLGNKGYNVDFPDLEPYFTCCESLEHAKEIAKKTLTGYLESLHTGKLNIAEPSNINEKDIFYIESNTYFI